MTIAPLHYGNREMVSEPINLPLSVVADLLRQGLPVSVELEPGDATYYHLLIVPAWATYVAPFLGRYGIPRDRATDYLIVTRLTDQEGLAFYATANVGDWDLPGIENEWTRDLLVWWLRHLWQLIERAR